MPEQQFGGPIAGRPDIGDLLPRRLRVPIGGGPGDAEIGEAGGADGGREEDVGGFDVAVDDAVGVVEVGEGGEEVVEDGAGDWGWGWGWWG